MLKSGKRVFSLRIVSDVTVIHLSLVLLPGFLMERSPSNFPSQFEQTGTRILQDTMPSMVQTLSNHIQLG